MEQQRLLRRLPSAPPADEKTLLVGHPTPRYVGPSAYVYAAQQSALGGSGTLAAYHEQYHQQHQAQQQSRREHLACAYVTPVAELRSCEEDSSNDGAAAAAATAVAALHDGRYDRGGAGGSSASGAVRAAAQKVAVALGIELRLPRLGSCTLSFKVTCSIK